MTELLDALLDTLIPPSDDGRMPGAGSLGLADDVAERAAAGGELYTEGIAAVEAAGFAALDPAARVALLRDLETSRPGFVPLLYHPACALYYQHPRVQQALGMRPGPPHPEGYPLEAGDLDALERVRARGPLYREV